MKKNYKILLSILGILIIASIILETSYGLWNITSTDTNIAITESGCVEIIYSDEKEYNLLNPASLTEEDGKRTTPKTISVNNKCNEVKTISVSMDVLSTSTIDSSKIKVNIMGDFPLESTFLNTLKQIKNTDETFKEKRLLLKYDLEPNTTNRLNLRMWLDSESTITKDKNSFYTNYYVTAKTQVIKPTLSEKIIADNGTDALISNKVPTPINTASITDEGLFNTNNYYYFRGAVTNNYFKFANKLWRVVGINPDNSLKLIYSDTLLETTYNLKNNNEAYTAFTSNLGDANIKTYLDDFYTNNLKDYDEFIINYNFCNDTSNTKYYNRINYGTYSRIYEENLPITTCPTTDKDYGGIYTSKIGLITMDEVILAGASTTMDNQSFYLYTGNTFYTMSPAYYNYYASMAVIDPRGKADFTYVTNNRQVNPVINLNASLNLKGTGTVDDPYELDLED